jgi:hypothetical protein
MADHVRGDDQHAVSHLAQHFFSRVRHTLQPRQSEEAAGAFDGMHQREDQRERAGVIRRSFEPHQRDIEFGQVLGRLGEEIGEQVVHTSVPTVGRSGQNAILGRRMRRNGKCPGRKSRCGPLV